MYEENNPPLARRIVWLVLWFFLIVAVAWIAVWLVFFHHSPTKKVAAPPRIVTGQQTATGNGAPSAASPSSPSSFGVAPSQSGNGPQLPAAQGATTQTPQLANTGPGNLTLPITLAVVVGSGMQYVRIRKRLAA